MQVLSRVLGVSRSGYYAWRRRGPSRRAQENAALAERIRHIYHASGSTYGMPRVRAERMLQYGIRCSRKRVARLMRRMNLVGVHRRHRRAVARRTASWQRYPDRVARAFTASAPNRLWVADVTQHATDEGWLYVAVVLDAFSRKVVGWAMDERLDTALVVQALDMALWNRRPPPGLVHPCCARASHSDHGAPYTSLVYGRRLEEAGILGSMGSVGDALDNAVAESFFATLQTELLDRRTWPTRRILRSAVFTYIEGFYNHRRRHSSLGHLSPEEFERRWYLAREQDSSGVA